MRRTLVAALMLVSVSATLLIGADPKKPDPVEALITRALAAHKAGKTQQAVADLQQAVTLMQKSLQAGLASFFPKAPAGWEAGKIDSSTMAAASGADRTSWTTLTRKYVRKADKLAVTVSMINAPHLIQAQQTAAAMYRNPQMLQRMNQNPKQRISLVSAPGWTGWKVVQVGRRAQVTAFCSGCLLSVKVPKDDEKALDAIWKGVDLKGLAAATKPPAGKK